MEKKKIVTYSPTIEDEFSEDGQILGINLISNVENPAVKIRGVAFSNKETKNLRFKDDIKMRIVAPVLVPGSIYQNDSGEEYYMKFTQDDIEILAKDFMSKLNSKSDGVFNLEHGDHMVDSYILESILVDSDNKVKLIKEDYGIDVPLGTFILVQQFEDRKIYDDIVKRGATSFSLEGFIGTKLINSEYKFSEKKQKNKMTKMKNGKKIIGTKRVFMSASKKVKMNDEIVEAEDIILIAEDFKEGEKVNVIEDVEAGVEENYTGEIDTSIDGEDKTIIIKDGVIDEVVESETEEAEVVEEVEVEAEDKEEEDKEVKAEDVVVTEPAETSNELEEIYKILADIKVSIDELKVTETPKDVEEVNFKEQKYTNALRGFNKFNAKKG